LKAHFKESITVTKLPLIDDLWILERPLHYYSKLTNVEYEVPVGFVTDFATVPRWAVIYLLTANTGHRAALLHDYLYRLKLVKRRCADAIFFEALVVDGEPLWRCYLMWAGVRLGGWVAWNRKKHSSLL
jgi:hypothetical protein